MSMKEEEIQEQFDRIDDAIEKIILLRNWREDAEWVQEKAEEIGYELE